MPTIITTQEQPRSEGPGWSETLIADATIAGETINMSARRHTLAAGVRIRPIDVGPDEAFVYVVEGTGTAHVGEERFPLAKESVLWLDPGDPQLELEGGPAGLDVLFARAPGA